MEKVWRRVGLHSSRKKRDGSGTSQEVTSSAPPEAEYQNIHTLRTADLIRQRQGEEKSTLRSSYIIRNGDNFILVERRRRRRRRSGTRASSGSRHHTPPVEETRETRTEQKRRPPARLKIFGIQWPLHSSDSRHTSVTWRFCRGRRSRDDNELYRSNSFKFERFSREQPADEFASQAALCADYSVPADCIAGPAPRPSSFHEISAPKVEFLEAYCTPRDTARRSPQRSRRSREQRRSPDSARWRYDTRRSNYDFDSCRRPYDYESGRRYPGREFDGDSGRRVEFDAESARRRADYESARRTDFDLSAPGVSRRSPESAPEGSAESPPEPAPSAPLRHERQPRHRSQPYYESESTSEDPSSSTDGEEDEFGEFDPFATAPSLHSPDSGRSDPRYANAPRRNPSPYYYGDLFKTTAPPQPAPSAPTVSTTSSSRGPRYRKSASLDAPHVAARPNLPKRFSVAEDGFRELERSSSSSGESAWMPPRRRGRDAAGCVCAAPEDVEEHRPSRSVFYVPAPLPRWPQEMSTRQIYETAFDCKIARSDDDLDDFDRVSNHPALLQAEDRKVISSASSAFEAVERGEPDYKGRRKVTMKTDSVRRSKIPTIRQKRENESNASALSEELEKIHIDEEDRNASTSQLPLRGYTPSPPSTAPLPTKFQQKDGSAMNSIKSAPNLPQSQPAHPRLKDLRLPVKSLRARETPTSSDASMVDLKGSASTELDAVQRLSAGRESRDTDDERGQSKDGIFLEIKGRPTSDSDTPELNRHTGPKGVGPIMEFKGRPGAPRPRRKYSSTESMATSSSGGSMESLRSSTSEDRSSSSSESRRSSSLSSHSSDSGNVPFTKSHHMQLSGFGHHTNKLHILSPISDKSSQEPASETSDNNRNNNSQKVSPEDVETGNTTIQTTVEIVAKPKRRALQNRNLLNLTFRHSTTAGDAEIQGSDSGISIHSREGVDSRNTFMNFKNSNTEEERKDPDQDLSDLPFDMPKLRRRRAEAEADLRSLPFDMPKLRRKLRGQSLQLNNDFGSVISNASSSQSVQDLNLGNKHKDKLTLNFDSGSGSGSSKGLHLNLGPIIPPRDLVDATLPLDRQGWYHGTLTRVEAESLLRDADEGAFLVRNSESAKHDYSLSLKSTRGFMHMRICRNTEGYTLGGAATAFPTVPTLMRHYVTAQRLPVRGAEHMALSTPLPAVLL
ncbi:uncharacterized protein LOC134656246 isoform X2 [Cydia amplana]|uniref:uncharacterized protein LOC134656246 isoform X2 n=1 Tax=Cydia amplana TaxID=1869771 RepID=UPI002FE60A25